MLTLRPVFCKWFVLLAATVLSPQHAAGAQPKEERLTLVIYQVGDLVLNVHDHPYPGAGDSSLTRLRVSMGGMGGMGGGGMGMGGMGGVGGGMGTAQQGRGSLPAPPQITLEDLEGALASVVEPTSWDEVGGPGSVGQLGNSLLVSQTLAVHVQIKDFLKQLREGSGERKTVTVDARWLLLDSDELDRLILPDRKGPPEVDRKALAALTRRPSSLRGLTNCFSGQLVYLVSGTRRTVVASYIPVVGSLDRPEERGARYASLGGGARYVFASQETPFGGMAPGTVAGGRRSVGYQPVIEKPNFGVLLEIRPTVVSGADTAIVDLRSTLTVPAEPAANPAGPPVPDRIAPAVDRLAIEIQELATTLRMPLGRPVLVGGLTYMGNTPEVPKELLQLYLVLELR